MYLVPNVWATVVSGLFYFLFGGIWYAGIFGRQWQAGLGFTGDQLEAAKKSFPKALVTHLISGIITAYVIGRVILVAGSVTFLDGVIVGLWLWVGFAFTITLNARMFEMRSRGVFLINTTFYLITFAVIGGINAIWH